MPQGAQFFQQRRFSLARRPSSYIKISAPHGNEDGLHSYDDRPHAHKALNFLSKYQQPPPISFATSNSQGIKLLSNVRRFSPFYLSPKQHTFIFCLYHIFVYQQNRKKQYQNIKLKRSDILIEIENTGRQRLLSNFLMNWNHKKVCSIQQLF